MDYLVSVADLKVFGCSIDFLQTATQIYLEDPIWDKLQQGTEYTIVFRNCSVVLPSQAELQKLPYPSHSASSSCLHEPRGNCPRRGLCRHRGGRLPPGELTFGLTMTGNDSKLFEQTRSLLSKWPHSETQNVHTTRLNQPCIQGCRAYLLWRVWRKISRGSAFAARILTFTASAIT